MKRLFGLSLCTVMVIAAVGGVLVFGDDAANDNNGAVRGAGSAEDVVYESVNAVDQHDIDAYISLQCDENKADYENFFRGLDWDKDNDGIMCVDAASIYEIREIPVDAADAFTSVYKYREKYDELAAFYVGIDYKVNNESEYFFNGVNYRLIVAGKEKGEWRIVEESDAPVELLSETRYAFKSAAEEKALKIVNARMNGIILNGNLEEI